MAAQEKFRGEGGRKLKCVCALPFTDNVRPLSGPSKNFTYRCNVQLAVSALGSSSLSFIVKCAPQRLWVSAVSNESVMRA